MHDSQNQKSIKYLLEVEALGQDILTDKETKLDLSNARNKFREALRALEATENRKTWFQLGSVYVEKSTKDCIELLKTEIINATHDLDELEIKIKQQLHKMRDLEHEPRLEGFTLKPISSAEAKVLHKSFGLV